MPHSENEISEIIARKISGYELTAEEERALDEWKIINVVDDEETALENLQRYIEIVAEQGEWIDFAKKHGLI